MKGLQFAFLLQEVIFCAAAFSVSPLPEPVPQVPQETPAETPEFNWTTLTASTKIIWHPCYVDLRCALLSVPYDWTNPTNLTFSLAVTSLAADVPPTDPAYRGPLLMNPGGPGGSGTGLIKQKSKLLAERVPRTYDILSWDPRGIGFSTPAPACFPTSAAKQEWWAESAYALNQHNIPDEVARTKSFWKFCDEESQSWVSTPNVARDMLAVHEAAWEAAGGDGKAKGLRFWGLSYGSALGMTFAQLYPERVERMILDGVVDIKDYFAAKWEKNIQDMDATLERFFVLCNSAKPGKCGFAANSTSVGDLRKRWEVLVEKLEQHPLPLFGDAAPGSVGKDALLGIVLAALYDPTAFPLVDTILTNVLKGNGTLLAAITDIPVDPTLPNGAGNEAGFAVFCSDAFSVHGRPTIPVLRKHLRVLEKQTRWFAGLWALLHKECSGWEKPALGVQRPSSWGVELKNKILFVGNEWDPVTPVRNAKAMSKLWPGSGFLFIKGGVGHCTVVTNGTCVVEKFEKYLDTGKVSGGESCQADPLEPFELPFKLPGSA